MATFLNNEKKRWKKTKKNFVRRCCSVSYHPDSIIPQIKDLEERAAAKKSKFRNHIFQSMSNNTNFYKNKSQEEETTRQPKKNQNCVVAVVVVHISSVSNTKNEKEPNDVVVVVVVVKIRRRSDKHPVPQQE